MTDALLDTTLISRLLGRALQGGAEFAEVYVQRKKALGIELDDSVIKSAQTSTSHGVGIRVISGSQVAYAHSDDLSEAALLECADAASKIGHGPKNVHVAKPLSAADTSSYWRPENDPEAELIEDKLACLRRADETARDKAKSVFRILGGYADTFEDILIANTEGLYVEDTRTLSRLSLQVIVKDKDGRPRVGSYGGGSRRGFAHYGTLLVPEDIAAEAVRMAEAQLGAKPAEPGEQVVVLGPASSGILLHEAVGHGLEADFIRKKSSIFTGRLGEKVASEHCTIIDDGTIAESRGSLNVDDEGTPTARNVLIEKGILKGYLSDRMNADLMGLQRSGNGRRQSFRHKPLPRMTNTFMENGDVPPEDILRGVKKGLYCKAFGGGQVDIANGNFVFEVREGYNIEDGKLTSPVQGATLVGNGPETLGKVGAVGTDADFDPGMYTCGKAGQSVPVTVGLPTVRIDGVTVGGTSS